MDTAIRSTLLVIDDSPSNLAVMSSLLKQHYRVKVATDGQRGLRIALTQPPPDLILLDVVMPGLDGYETCRQLKQYPQTREIPVIFLTARSDVADEQQGLELGAVDYIAKPVSPPILLARVRTHLQLKQARDLLANHNRHLEQEVARRTRELSMIQDVTIMAMASLAETRDNETGNHIRRTQYYVRCLAERLATYPKFTDYLTPEHIELLFKSAPLHDIGKVGIPDHILLKRGKLTADEFEVMKTHTTLGRDAILVAEQMLETPNSFLRFAREIAYSHQEKWDGSGYPQGLRAEDIPLSARLMAVADVYDALISRRVYKPAFTHEDAIELICRGSGSHFDPDVVAAFLQCTEDFRLIATRFTDNEQAHPFEDLPGSAAEAAIPRHEH